jgi:hypothetical protein
MDSVWRQGLAAITRTRLRHLLLSTAYVAACLLFSTRPGWAEEEKPTPLAGEAFDTEVLGEPVQVAPRDRKSVTAASFGIQYLPDGPSFYQVLPFGGNGFEARFPVQ